MIKTSLCECVTVCGTFQLSKRYFNKFSIIVSRRTYKCRYLKYMYGNALVLFVFLLRRFVTLVMSIQVCPRMGLCKCYFFLSSRRKLTIYFHRNRQVHCIFKVLWSSWVLYLNIMRTYFYHEPKVYSFDSVFTCIVIVSD